MWDHQLFYGAEFEGNSRGKSFCLYDLPLFVIHLCLCTPTLPTPACQLFDPGTTWPGADTSFFHEKYGGISDDFPYSGAEI